jgi:hypothetical protein
MIKVEVARRRGARAMRSRRMGGSGPRKVLWRARVYFFCSCAVAVWAICVVPAIYAASGGKAGGEFAGWLRLAIFAGSLWSLALLLMSIGVGITGQRMGVLWTARNTYSLSRLQVALWTLIVMAGLAAAVVCRAHGLFVPAGSSGFAGALDVRISSELLTVLGVSIGSAAAVPAILSVKAKSDDPPRAQLAAATRRVGSRIDAVGQVATRPSDYPPLIEDLFQGDDVATAGAVDIGKVQQAIVTLILLAAYLGMLAELFITGSWKSSPGLSSSTTLMPGISETFVYLFGISHVGYLAYKAVPAGPATSGAVSRGPTTPKPGSHLPRPQPPSLAGARAALSQGDIGASP